MTSLLLLFLVAQADVPPPEYFAPNDEVRGYIEQAVAGDARHPMLDAAMEEYHAGVQRVPQEKALDDPMFEATYWTRSSGGEPRYSVMMSQMFPWFGTRKARGEMAAAEADAKLAGFRSLRNERIADVKKAYIEYWFLAERTRIAMDQVGVLESLEEVVRSRYALGIGGQEDLLRVEIEQAKLQAGYDCCALERAARVGKLNEALGREAGADLPLPQAMELPPPPPPTPVLLARLRVANPALEGFDAEIESKDSAIALARKKGKPDITVGLSYTDMKDLRNEPRAGAVLDALGSTSRLVQPRFVQTPLLPQGATPVDRVLAYSNFKRDQLGTALDGTMDVNSLVELENAFDNEKMKDEVMVSVGMNLPIWRSKVRAGIEEANHMKAAAQHDKRKTLVEFEGAAKMAVFGIEDGYRRLKLYDEKLLPQVKQTYQTLEGAYSAGNAEAGFLDVLMTVQTRLEFEEQRAEAVRDIQLASADLELILGGPWSTNDTAPPAAATDPTPSPEPEHTPSPEHGLAK